MTDLITKIKARYDADSTLDDAPLWLGRAKDRHDFPYTLLRPTGSLPATHFFIKDGVDLIVEDQFIEFHILDDDLLNVSALQTALHGRFDKCSLTLTVAGDIFLACLRDINHITIDPQLSSDTLAIYRAVTRYHLKWQNNL